MRHNRRTPPREHQARGSSILFLERKPQKLWKKRLCSDAALSFHAGYLTFYIPLIRKIQREQLSPTPNQRRPLQDLNRLQRIDGPLIRRRRRRTAQPPRETPGAHPA